MLHSHFFNSDLGEISLAENGLALCFVEFRRGRIPANAENRPTPLLLEAERQLRAYLNGKLKEFDLPLEAGGSEFQKKVWLALLEIPYGETRSYKDIAASIGSPKACRAVGLANNRNPISIIVPCHRVIGADGSLVGYGGGLETKRFLLELEQFANK